MPIKNLLLIRIEDEMDKLRFCAYLFKVYNLKTINQITINNTITT